MLVTGKHGTILFFLLMGIAPSPGETGVRRGGERIAAIGIENFESGSVVLSSYPGEDQQPSGWHIDSLVTHNGSSYSLCLTGNTWKIEAIQPVEMDSGDVWDVAAFVQQIGEIQGFGIRDSVHDLLFSFAGTEEVDPNAWVTVYQGAFPTGVWNTYRLPIADEWLSRYGYLPRITDLVFINDRDSDPTATIYFDDIRNITPDLPSAPLVSITYTTGMMYRNSGGRLNVDVQFFSHVTDPDSGVHIFFWRFGDDSTSTDTDPLHTFIVEDDHAYRVLLEVTDDTGLHGRASCVIQIDPGPTSFPLSMNFVGDVMLARNYEAPGGIIPTRGVQAIFAPTRSVLGDAADITVANMECSLTQTGTPHPTKPIVFRGSPANAAGLSYAGIDIVTLANNHIVDYGLDGLRETQSTLRQHGIVYSGAGGTSTEAYEPVFVSRSGLTFGFLAFSDRTGQYNNYQPYLDAGENKPGFANLTAFELIRRIANVRDDADVLVVEMHSGSEYSTEPGVSFEPLDGDEGYVSSARGPLESDRQVRRLALETGADLVVCHHPHITQGFEVYGGKLIAHSLGNFAFDLSYTETFPSVILRAEVEASGITGYTVTPIYIDDYIPLRAQGELGLHILDDLAMKSRELGTTLVVDRSSVTGAIILDTLALTPRQVIRTAVLPLHQSGGSWVSRPLRLPRGGSLYSVSSVTPSGSWSMRVGREVMWMGNFEDEGCSLWELATSDEGYDTSASHGGRRSLRQRRASGAGSLVTSLEHRLKTGGGLAFSLCGWIRTTNARDVDAVLKFYNTRTAFSEIGSGDLGSDVDGTTGWTFLANDVSAPAGTAFLDIELTSTGPSSGTGYGWFDNISVVEWSEWTPIGGIVPCPNDYYWVQVRTTQTATTAAVTYEELEYLDTHLPVQIQVPISTGWNMVSNPVTLPDSLTDVHSLFPHSAFEHAFGFSPGVGYVPSTTLPNGPGFWVKFPADETVTISGTPRPDDSIAVVRGWNMIGSVSAPVDTSLLRSVPTGLMSSVIYGYGAGYFPSGQILPGAAYWVKCSDSGHILLSGSPRISPAGMPHARRRSDISVTVADARGRSQTLLVGTGGELQSRYEMPPPPPEGSFDVRFSSGYLAVAAEGESSSVHPITVSSPAYPLTVSWKIHDDGVNAELLVGSRTIPFERDGSAQIIRPAGALSIRLQGLRGDLPTEFALEQNYPNPFNPSTVIRYAVPVKIGIFIGVYAVTGQLVRTLVTGEQIPGHHVVVWDGLNDRGQQVGSGVYFSRLTAGFIQHTHKLLLLR